jgi:hypothetical protein
MFNLRTKGALLLVVSYWSGGGWKWFVVLVEMSELKYENVVGDYNGGVSVTDSDFKSFVRLR